MTTREQKWILDDDGLPVPEPDVLKWGQWCGSSKDKRILKQEDVNGHWVSTVFLGLDHSFTDQMPPLLWETEVFTDGKESVWMERCATREEALAMHERGCSFARSPDSGEQVS